MKKLKTKDYKFIVSVEFEASENLDETEVKTVLNDKLKNKTKVFKDVELLWRVK